MPASLSPSIGSTTLTCQQRPTMITSNSNMRLPPMNEFLRKTDRVSDHNRTLENTNSTARSIQIPSEDQLIDLTSDSLADSFPLPNFQHFSDASLSYNDSNYFTLFDMPPRSGRRSRESTIGRERPVKRRRGNDFLGSFSPPSTSSASRPSFKVEPTEVLDLTSPPRKDDTSRAALKRKASEELKAETDEDKFVPEPENDQDKQLADTIKAQAGLSQGSSKLNQLTCIICMDNMTNMTATVCGHVFCHTCIMEALIAGENRADGRPAPKCPMCRKKLRRKGLKVPEIIPLNLKLKVRSEKAKGKQKEIT